VSNLLMERALEYARRGLPVCPCKPSSKAPYIKGGLNSASTDPDVIRDWWAWWPHAMIGVRMGEESGVWALDPDRPVHPEDPDGMANWTRLCTANGGCPRTHTHLTPRGGKHLLFKWRKDRPVTNSEGRLKGLGINVRGDGGYVIFPPSQRHDGKAYEIEDPFDHFNFAEAPEWLYELILTKRAPKTLSASERALVLVRSPAAPSRDNSAYVEAAVRNEFDAVASTAQGGRNNQLNASAFSLGTLVGAGELSQEEAEHALYQAAVANGHVADTGSRQTNATISSGLRAGIKHPRTIPDLKAYYPQTHEAAGSAQPQPAAEPVDLWANFDPPTLPPGLLPPLIEDFAFAKGRATGADMAGFAACALPVCAAAIPDRVKLQVKRHDPSWLEAPRLWVAVVGMPSTKKSPILKAVTKPLRKLNDELADRYQVERKRYDALSKDDKEGVEPPKRTQLIINDATVEAAQEVMRDSPDGALCVQDELAGWFGSMDKYSGGKGGDRGFWLQAYNGGTYHVQRIARGFVKIDNLSISLVGGIQPDPIRKIAADTVDDGLLQRILPIILKPSVKGRDEPEPPAVSEYAAMIARLRRLDAMVLRLDEGAQAYRVELEEKHLSLQDCEAVDPKLAAHIGKYDGIFARLCIVFHCVENAMLGKVPHVISADTARRAGGFLHGFLLPHALAFHVGMLGLSNDHDRLAAIAGHILAKGMGTITNREVKSGIRPMRKATPREVEEALQQLEALGWLDRVVGPRPTSPARWTVNPVVHVNFAERAKEEERRRKNVRKIMSNLTKGLG
jgi:Protein of unknown function (DUF3987)/Bifunctional DNA primase/polymerase, N-terminal